MILLNNLSNTLSNVIENNSLAKLLLCMIILIALSLLYLGILNLFNYFLQIKPKITGRGSEILGFSSITFIFISFLFFYCF